MIYRSSTQALRVQDYSEPQTTAPLIAGGVVQSGGCVYVQAASYALAVGQVLGMEVVMGGVSVAGTPLGRGALLLQASAERLSIWQDGVALADLTRASSELPWTVDLLAETVLRLALLSPTRAVTLTNAAPGSTLGGVGAVGGTVTRMSVWPRDATSLSYVLSSGGAVDATVGPLLPGDQLTYVPPDYQPQPSGAGYRLSRRQEPLQARIDAVDAAFIGGGLKRQTPALSGLMTPASAEPVPTGGVTYRLDDGGAPLDVRVDFAAGQTTLRVTVTVAPGTAWARTRSLTVPNGDLHVHATPSQLALAAAYQGTGAHGLALERNALGEVFLYACAPQAQPSCAAYTPAEGVWRETPMSYVVPGGAGTLVDRRDQVRRSAGPYLIVQQNDAHALALVLSGALDSTTEQYVPLIIAGRLRRYVHAGLADFDSRLCLMVPAE